MGRHKAGQKPVGAFVNVELRNYLDRLADERGYSVRSDAVRAVIREHKAVFSKSIDGMQALTPFSNIAEDNHHEKQKTIENQLK